MEEVNQTTKEEILNKAFQEADLAYEAYKKADYYTSKRHLINAHKSFINLSSIENISICLSWIALLEYKTSEGFYFMANSILNDAKFLAEKINNEKAKFLNDYIFALICYEENDFKTANLYINKLNNYNIDDEFFLNEKRNLEAKLLKSEELIKSEFANIKKIATTSDPLIALLNIAKTVAAQTNIDILLEKIAQETKNTLEADRCTVFLLDKEKNELWSKIALGMDSQTLRFPADKGLAGHVVQTGETIIIGDAYKDKRFNKEVDIKTGYVTKSILCMPIKNMQHEIIGVFQVLNKNNGAFTKHDEDLLIAIGSSAGIALENATLFKHQEEMIEMQKTLFASFIDTLAASIDARDKITAGHSTRVKMYSNLISEKLNLSDKTREEIDLAAILHDIGKIGIKDSILQKDGKLTPEEYAHIQTHVQITHDILSKIYLSDEYKNVTEIASSHHEKYDGSGYFRHLKGEEIHIGGRVLAVGDVFDAITSRRHYRDKMPIYKALTILIQDKWKHFDGNVVDAFFKINLDKLVEVFLSEFGTALKQDEQEILSTYTISSFYDILSKIEENKNLTSKEKNIVNIFMKYYDNKSLIHT